MRDLPLLPSLRSWVRRAAGSVVLALPLHAQCANTLVVEGSSPEADGLVAVARWWDPDLSGPASAVVVVGGNFRSFGNAVAAGLASYEPVGRVCAPLVGSLQVASAAVPGIRAIAVAANNDLIVSGIFDHVNGIAANGIARWNGVAWQPLGAGLPGPANTLLALPNGDVLAGGYFTPGGNSVLRWDGVTWSPFGAITGTVQALVAMPNGDVVAGGTSLLPGDLHLARWTGAGWSSFASSPNAGVLALKVAQNGDLLVTGGFLQVGSVPAAGVARFDGTNWQGFGGGMFNPVLCIEELANGDLVACGLFSAVDGILGSGGTPAAQVARWNGSQWSAMGAGLPPTTPTSYQPVRTLLRLPNGDVLAGGDFLPGEGAAGTNYVARWDGSNWSSIRPGTGGSVLATVTTASGLRYAVGSFTGIEGVAANRVAVRVNGAWQALGSGADDAVHAVLPLPNGDVVIGGEFTSVGGVPCQRIAHWNGAVWSPIGAGLSGTVRSLAVDALGQLIAAGDLVGQQIAVFDGQTWNGTGTAGGLLQPTGALRRAVDGGVLAAYASQTGTIIARWNGAAWLPIVAAQAYDFGQLSNGDLVVASLSLVRRWNGVAWTNYPPTGGTVRSLVVLPNDDLLVGTSSSLLQPATRLHRWNGLAWTVLGDAVGGGIDELRWQLDGTVSVCGSYRQLFGVAASAFARLATNCPASTVLAGAGCSGSGGPNSLVATSLPWAGSTFTSRAAGLLPGSLALEVLGLSPLSTPLAALLPQGGVGCSLLASPDVLRAYLVPGSQLDLGLAIPDSTAWIGASLRQQVVPVEIDAAGAIQALTATPALELTIGRF